MIRVTVELIPHGDEVRKRVVGVMEIANDGTGDQVTGNYKGTLHAEYTKGQGRNAIVRGFNRKTQSVWTLIGQFLKQFNHVK